MFGSWGEKSCFLRLQLLLYCHVSIPRTVSASVSLMAKGPAIILSTNFEYKHVFCCDLSSCKLWKIFLQMPAAVSLKECGVKPVNLDLASNISDYVNLVKITSILVESHDHCDDFLPHGMEKLVKVTVILNVKTTDILNYSLAVRKTWNVLQGDSWRSNFSWESCEGWRKPTPIPHSPLGWLTGGDGDFSEWRVGCPCGHWSHCSALLMQQCHCSLLLGLVATHRNCHEPYHGGHTQGTDWSGWRDRDWDRDQQCQVRTVHWVKGNNYVNDTCIASLQTELSSLHCTSEELFVTFFFREINFKKIKILIIPSPSKPFNHTKDVTTKPSLSVSSLSNRYFMQMFDNILIFILTISHCLSICCSDHFIEEKNLTLRLGWNKQ